MRRMMTTMMMMMMMMMMTLVSTFNLQVCLHRPTHKVSAVPFSLPLNRNQHFCFGLLWLVSNGSLFDIGFLYLYLILYL